MARLALISKHIVLTELEGKSPSYPKSGVILIENGFICQVEILDSGFDSSELLEKYSSWNPVDFSDFYISPGIIDLSTRLEWESYSQLTVESVKGGVTCVVTEPGHFQHNQPVDLLYCDVCQMSIIDDLTTSIPPETYILKAYLFPPSPEIRSVANIGHVVQFAANSGLPFFIDPTMPDPRMLYMASPHRLDNVEDRGRNDISSGSTVFAAAFPESLESSDSEDIDSDSETEPPLPKKLASLQQQEIKPFIRHNRSISNEKNDVKNSGCTVIQEELLGAEHLLKMRKSSHDIYQDLDDRIKERQRSIEDLCRAETSTYNNSGSTSFLTIEVPKKSSSMTSFNFSLESPEVPIQSPQVPPEPCRRKLRPSPIQIKSVSKPDIHKDYNYFLANCPESWETQGVQKVLESLKPSHSVHFTGISSAAGINTLRHFKKTFKSLTCDISISHLCFTSASIGIGDTRFKSAPPIRNQGNCNLLWDLLKMKGIDCICSAHSFILPALKLTENFQQSLSGIPAAGLSLFAVWNMLNVPVSTQEQLEHYIVRLAKWLSLHPARVLRLSHERGRIEKGLRADLVVWNPFQKYCFQQDWRYQATSPFKMQEMMGRVLRVYLKGEVVFDGEKGCEAVGEIIKRV